MYVVPHPHSDYRFHEISRSIVVKIFTHAVPTPSPFASLFKPNARVSSRRAAPSAKGLGAMGHGGNNVIPNVHFRRLAELIPSQYYPGRNHGGCDFNIFGTINILNILAKYFTNHGFNP